MPRKQNENLIPFTGEQSREEAVKNGKKGGKASGEARRKKKALREEMEELLSLPLTNPKMLQNLVSMGVPAKKNSTFQTLISASMIYQAAKGNVKAYTAIRDTLEVPKSEEKEKAISEHMRLMRQAFDEESGQTEDDGDE